MMKQHAFLVAGLVGLLFAGAGPSTATAAAPRAPGGEEPTLTVYDIRDLVDRMQDLRDEFGPLPDEGAPPDEEEIAAYREKSKLARTKMIRDAIRLFVTPPIEDEESVTAVGAGMLVVRALDAQHAWVESFLERRRRMPRYYVRMEMQFIAVDGVAIGRLGLGTDPVVLEREADRDAFLAKVVEDPGATVVSSPRLLVEDLYSASISIGSPVHFVTGYEVYENVEPGGSSLVVPVVESRDGGVRFEVRQAILDEGRIGLDFDVKMSSLLQPVETRSTEHGEIAVPTMRTMEVASRVILANGASVVFLGGREGGDPDETRHVLLLHARIFDPEEKLPR